MMQNNFLTRVLSQKRIQSKRRKKSHMLWDSYFLRQSKAKILFLVMALNIVVMPCTQLVAHQKSQESLHVQYQSADAHDQDLQTILTSNEPLLYLGPSYKELIASLDLIQDGELIKAQGLNPECSVITLSALESVLKKTFTPYPHVAPASVTMTHDKTGQAITRTIYQCDDAYIAPSAHYADITFTFDGVNQLPSPSVEGMMSQSPSTCPMDYIFSMLNPNNEPSRAFNDSYIKINADGNTDMRITGSVALLGLVTLPGAAANQINGSPIVINAAGQLGVGSGSGTGTYTFTSDIFVAPGTTLYVDEIDPRSPTTTTTFSGSISLPLPTTANNGSLQIDGVPFLHNFGSANTFVGANAGNLVMSGIANVAVGTENLAANTSGSFNTSSGVHSLFSNTTGSFNTSSGLLSLEKNTVGVANTALGFQALNSNITGSNNTALGASSLASFRIGDSGFHTGVGGMALNYLITGTGNTALGNDAGAALLIGSNNIYIANRGVAEESNVIRLGAAVTHTGCFIPTIANTSLPAGLTVVIDSATGLLGVGSGSGTGTYTFTSDIFVAPGTTLYVDEIDPRSPTTTTTFSGSISLPNTTTANNGSLQMNGIRFLHDFGTDNIFAGANAGNFTMTGTLNVAVGTASLSANTTGSANSALGAYSLQNNTIGANNCALGAFALQNNDSGFFNTALGSEALRNNTIAIGNTALGAFALKNNTTGAGNSAVGVFALGNNTTGAINTALGTLALQNNTVGSQNCGLGSFALHSNQTGNNNTAVGAGALLSSIDANDNTAVGGGCLQSNTTGTGNSAVGASSLQNNTTGINNSALGAFALQQNNSGLNNTAFGTEALRNNDANDNTAVGTFALSQNTSGIGNTAVGTSALSNNAIGESNVAVGGGSLGANTTGFYNTALGTNSMPNSTTAGDNVAVGNASQFNNLIGPANTAVGSGSLYANTTSASNTAIGAGALQAFRIGDKGLNATLGFNTLGNLITGTANTAIGATSVGEGGTPAGISLIAGSDNVYIANPGVVQESSVIRLGTTATHTACFVAGIDGTSIPLLSTPVLVSADGQLGTIASSIRYKEDIKDMDLATDNLKKLRPVMFRYKHDPSQLEYGLIAEEVEKVYPDLVIHKDGKVETVRYHILPVMLLNEYQKLRKEFDELSALIKSKEIDDKEKEINALA